MSTAFPATASLEDQQDWLRMHLLDFQLRKKARGIDFFEPFDWQKPFLESPAKQRFLIKGNRSGGSTVAHYEAARLATGRCPWWTKDRRATIWCVCPSHKKSMVDQRPMMAQFIPKGEIRSWRNRFNEKESELETDHATVFFKAYRQDLKEFEMSKVDLVVMSEYPPDDIYESCHARTIDVRGRIIAEFTPLEGLASPGLYRRIYVPYRRRKDKDQDLKAALVAPGIHVTTGGMYDNPLIPREEIDAFVREYSHRPMMVRVRVWGEWVEMGSEAILPAHDVLYDSTPDAWPRKWKALRGWIDANFGESSEGCETTVCIGGADSEGHAWTVDMVGGRWSTSEKVDRCVSVLARHGCPPTYVQPTGGDNLFLKLVNDKLHETEGCSPCVKPWKYHDWQGSGSVPGKTYRAEKFCALIKAGIVHARPDDERLRQQIAAFPAGDGDDWLDAWMGCMTALIESPTDQHQELWEAGHLPSKESKHAPLGSDYREDQEWYYDTGNDGLPDF